MEEEKWQQGREARLQEVAGEDAQIYACVRRKWVEQVGEVACRGDPVSSSIISLPFKSPLEVSAAQQHFETDANEASEYWECDTEALPGFIRTCDNSVKHWLKFRKKTLHYSTSVSLEGDTSRSFHREHWEQEHLLCSFARPVILHCIIRCAYPQSSGQRKRCHIGQASDRKQKLQQQMTAHLNRDSVNNRCMQTVWYVLLWLSNASELCTHMQQYIMTASIFF